MLRAPWFCCGGQRSSSAYLTWRCRYQHAEVQWDRARTYDQAGSIDCCRSGHHPDVVWQRGEATLATEAGAAGYLAKPLWYTQLYECLRVVLVQSSGGIGSGGLSVDTGVGGGTLPRSIPRQTGLVTRHTLAEARAQQAERILLADDNRPNQMLVVRLLERRGYRVDVVAGGSEALAQQPYDLLFLGCFMPDINGFETTRRIRSSEPPG